MLPYLLNRDTELCIIHVTLCPHVILRVVYFPQNDLTTCEYKLCFSLNMGGVTLLAGMLMRDLTRQTQPCNEY